MLFVNGIPFAVIECKRPDIKGPLEQAISQNIRNQGEDYIPRLFTFTQLLVSVTKNEASFGTTGTAAKFWSRWRELREGRPADVTAEVAPFVNRPLTKAQKDKLFADRFGYVRAYFDELEAERTAGDGAGQGALQPVPPGAADGPGRGGSSCSMPGKRRLPVTSNTSR